MDTISTLTTVLGVPVLIFLVIVAILGFLMPVYVASINGKLRHLNAQIDGLLLATRAPDKTKILAEALEESRAQSALLRQLLKAYGHEPEA